MPSVIYKKSVEGFGIAYIEAAQYGLPSIGGKDGGEADAIKNNETGIICDGNSLDEIYSSIDLILKIIHIRILLTKLKNLLKNLSGTILLNNILKYYDNCNLC